MICSPKRSLLTKNDAPKRISTLCPRKASADFLKACRQDRLAMTGAVHPTRDNDFWTEAAWTGFWISVGENFANMLIGFGLRDKHLLPALNFEHEKFIRLG